jgi:hypothetical protein
LNYGREADWPAWCSSNDLPACFLHPCNRFELCSMACCNMQDGRTGGSTNNCYWVVLACAAFRGAGFLHELSEKLFPLEKVFQMPQLPRTEGHANHQRPNAIPCDSVVCRFCTAALYSDIYAHHGGHVLPQFASGSAPFKSRISSSRFRKYSISS